MTTALHNYFFSSFSLPLSLTHAALITRVQTQRQLQPAGKDELDPYVACVCVCVCLLASVSAGQKCNKVVN